MKKIILIFCFLSAFVNAQITPLDQWKTKGNTFTTNTNYLGTNSNHSLLIKTNGTQRVKIDSIGNTKINGTLNVIGNTTFSGSITSPTVYGSSAAGGTLNIFSTSSATAGVINIGTSSGTINLNSGTANLTSSTTIGTGTVAANTSSLGIVRIKQGSGYLDFGETSSGEGAIWAVQSTPSPSNYMIKGSGAVTTLLNATSDLRFLINNGIVSRYNSGTFYNTYPTRIGSSTAPSATLDVTGTMSVSSTATLGGLSTTSGTLGNVIVSGNGVNGGAGSLSLQSSGSTKFAINSGGAVLTGTLGIGSTAYTGGTTAGTVAVLSDAVFGVTYSGTNGTFADATTYYLSTMPFPFQTISTGAVWLPYNCTLVGWNCTTYASNTPSTETSTLQIYVDGVATNLSTSISFTNSSAAATTFTASGLSQSISAGSKVEPRFIVNTMATNPTSACITVTFWFVRRQ